ncbi:MAG: threonine/serine exporter family protein [Planctomycetota bacterium]
MGNSDLINHRGTGNEEIHSTHAFLLQAAESLHRYGTPAFRLEGVMEKVASSLEVPSVFLYTPTALVVELGEGAERSTYVRRVESTDIDISKILAVDETLEALEAGRNTVAQSTQLLNSIEQQGPAFSLFISVWAAAVACGGIAIIFGGNILDVLVASAFGLAIEWATCKFGRASHRGFQETVLGFAVATSAVAVSRLIPINDRLITLAALILPIPGLTITIALTELTLKHLSSGSARLAGAMITLFTLVVGVAIAWRVTSSWRVPAPIPGEALPWWCLWLAVGLTPIAFAVVFRAPVSQWPAILAVVVIAFSVSRWIGSFAGSELGAFAGALSVGCASNAYARWKNRPAMITQTPGLLILVPGAVGYASLTAMIENDTLRGIELAFSMATIGVALVGGLLLANQLISPRRIL